MQRCRCLEKAGFPPSQPEFHVEIGPENLRPAEIAESERASYFHISPFTTADYKELAPEQLAELISAVNQQFPGKKIALSCAPTSRELAKMEKLLPLLREKPWRVFAGNLNLIQIAAVIKYSALHFCGDTGTFHLAVMTQTPVAGWFWPNPGIREWVPKSEKCRIIAGANPPGATFLADVRTNALIEAAKSALSAA